MWDFLRFTKGGARENRPPRGGHRLVNGKKIVNEKRKVSEKRIVTEREVYQTKNIPFIGKYG